MKKFKMKGFTYPGRSPLNQLGPGDFAKGKFGFDALSFTEGVSGAWDTVKKGAKDLMKSKFVKDVAVGAAVGMLTKKKNKPGVVRIIGEEENKDKNIA